MLSFILLQPFFLFECKIILINKKNNDKVMEIHSSERNLYIYIVIFKLFDMMQTRLMLSVCVCCVFSDRQGCGREIALACINMSLNSCEFHLFSFS